MAEYWPSFLFASLWTETKSRSIKMLKRLRGQYLASHLDQTSVVNKGFVIWHKEHTEKMIFVLFFSFSSTEKEASYLQK